ncbi:UNVERIFIED_CONTAM: hypothetical protein GTU68_022222 [Idotea baltica]|nr:hypothetical protein [Idotea baltica]
MSDIGIAIVGGTGYGARELLRLLASHDNTKVVSVVSSSVAGTSVSDSHPNLKNIYNLNFDSEINFKELSNYKNKIVFLSLPDNLTDQYFDLIIKEDSDIKIIDLSGSFRLDNKEIHSKFYPNSNYREDLRDKIVYGFPEINKDKIKKAKYLANPGCHVTACSLSTLPLASNYTGSIIFDSKSGSSGAGRKANENFHHPERSANFEAYKVLDHRHEPEIRMALGDIEGDKITSTFVPHLLPVSRGILATSYLTFDVEQDLDTLKKLYKDFYKDSPFVRIIDSSPSLSSVVGSNYCDINLYVRGKQVVCISVIDNLVKGMAGLAIQNMNLMFNLDETTGLKNAGIGLV